MNVLSRTILMLLLLGLLGPLPLNAQIIGKTTGRRKSAERPAAPGEETEPAAPVIGPLRLGYLPLPLVIPIGDRQHPPGAPFNPPGSPVAGGEFFPGGLIADREGQPGVVLDDFLVAPAPVTRRQYQLYLMYLDVFADHSHCHPFEPPAKDHRPEGWFDPLLCEDPDRPVTGIDWFDAFGFASWSGARLPTDLEWERAGLDAPVAEWLGSWYSADWYADPSAIREHPRGPASGAVTDGDWTFHQTMTIRQADGTRSWRNIYSRSPELGFRLAWGPSEPEEPAGAEDDAAVDVPPEPAAAGLESAGQ